MLTEPVLRHVGPLCHSSILLKDKIVFHQIMTVLHRLCDVMWDLFDLWEVSIRDSDGGGRAGCDGGRSEVTETQLGVAVTKLCSTDLFN